ncbi:BTAD domain-containing putative transcriptional regulator [Actinomycetospora soli]|uniref:BTAD domain-containing putative transcriptional regulator n=1 Tax=Actinomycetospora soli TaxID=2893887 RepID=UPI001E445381|nr:BTAD domain-containing putative transcriptional regulator [Actinomycetospora soli]MCD2187802.1 AAA family ATPase [Actinomycetospora soli]
MDDGTGERSPTSAAMQALLVLLASSPRTPVMLDTLAADLWADGKAPRNPGPTLHTRTTRLRDWLGIPREQLSSATGAYTLHLDPERVDHCRFHRLAGVALAAEDPATMLAAADGALAEWTGPPWPGVSTPRLDLLREHTLARHQHVLEVRVRALLGLGRALEAVDAVAPLALEAPDREAWHALLVTALHAAGRPRDAVEAFLAARRHLAEELGVGPGEELREAYRRVLLDRAAAVPTSGRPRRRIVGREAQLAAIAAATGDEDTQGRLVVVEGEAGIGKSTLLAAVREAASGRVLRGAWDEGATPLTAWVEALGPPPDGPAGAPVPWVRRRLAELAADGPVLVTLDDAHRADSASLGALTGLVRQGLPPEVVVLVAARVPDVVVRPDWSACRADLVRDAAAIFLPLTELDPEAVVALARARLTGLPDGAVVRVAELVASRAGGHPLHVAALLDVLAGAPDETAALEAVGRVPDRLRAVFDHQLNALAPEARRAIEALAVLRPVPTPALAAVLGRRGLDVVEDLRAAAPGLTAVDGERVDLRHDLVATAVRESVPTTLARELHRARLDHPQPEDDAYVRLRHVLGAGLPAEQVGLARRDAGVLAYERRALAEALELLDACGREDDPVVDVHRGLVLAGLGRSEEADDLLDAALARADGDPGLVVKAAVGDEALGRTVSGDRRRLARLHRAEAVALPPRERFELLVALVREESLAGVARPDLVAELRDRAATPGATVAVRARARALEVRQLVEGPEPAARRLALAGDALDLALRTGDPTIVLDATELLLTAALGAGDVARALGLRETLAVEARRWHRPRLIWAAQVLESALLLARGSYDEARAAAQASLELGQELGVGDALPAFGVHLMISAWMTGTADTLGDLAVGAAAQNPTIPAWAAAAAVARARSGHRREACELLAAFRERRAATASRLFDRPALCMAASAAVSLHDRETAALVRAELPADPDAVVILGYGAVVTGPAALFAGLAAMVLGDHATARTDVAAAEKLATGLGWTPWAEAAARVGAVLDGEDVELPLGMGQW